MSQPKVGIRAVTALVLFAIAAIVVACGADAAPVSERESRATATPRVRSVSISNTSSSDHGSTAATSSDSHGAAADDSHETAIDDSHAVAADDTHADDAHAEESDGHDDAHEEDADEEGGHGAPHWEYTGASGIVKWAELDDSFNTCVDGGAQSPIDVR